jgi:hypothetical protein
LVLGIAKNATKTNSVIAKKTTTQEASRPSTYRVILGA